MLTHCCKFWRPLKIYALFCIKQLMENNEISLCRDTQERCHSDLFVCFQKQFISLEGKILELYFTWQNRFQLSSKFWITESEKNGCFMQILDFIIEDKLFLQKELVCLSVFPVFDLKPPISLKHTEEETTVSALKVKYQSYILFFG